MNIKQEKVEKLIELYEKYKASSHKLEDELKAIGKDQFDMVIPDLHNPDRERVFDYIKKLSQIEQHTVKALMRFGQDFDIPSKKDFQFYIKYTHFSGDHDIDYLIAKPLSKYLRNGVMKLDLIKLTN